MSRRTALALVVALGLVAPVPATAAQASGLRGVRVTSMPCPTTVPAERTGVAITGTVRSIHVCPGDSPTGTGAVAAVTPTGQPKAFTALVSALREPDGLVTPGLACTMYADLPRLVYVVTSTGNWRVHLPVDACRHYRPSLLQALNAAAETVQPKGNPVVVIGSEGGFVAPGFIKYALPSLVVYANGSVLVRADDEQRPDLRVMRVHVLSASKLRALAEAIARAAVAPKGGWGSPGVADVPNTYVRIAYPNLKRNVSVYALSFTAGGDVTPEQAAARKSLQRAIDAMAKAVRTTRAHAWTSSTYEAWTRSPLVMVDGVGMPNPASVFCESMGGTLSIENTTTGQVGYCTTADGKRVEEWAYYRSTGPTLNQWPASVPAPTQSCTVVKPLPFLAAWQGDNETGRWLLPSGQAPTFVFRPVLPGERACQRG